MFKLTKKVEYALMCLGYLQKYPAQLHSVRALSDALHLPYDTVSKVMQKLVTHDVITSVLGVNGGYGIKKELQKLTFFQLYCFIEETPNEQYCGPMSCGHAPTCTIYLPVNNLSKKVQQFFKEIKLSDLINSTLESSSL
jgi:Rrf2 family protein